jgi:hypothetical protein
MAQKNDVMTPTGSIAIDAHDLDLGVLVGLEGSVLESIVREVREEKNEDPQARHSSHSSYSSHSQSHW